MKLPQPPFEQAQPPERLSEKAVEKPTEKPIEKPPKHSSKEPSCLFTPSFVPLFWVQFLGAFNDNVFKNAMIMLITFQLSNSSDETGLLITLAAGLFILPFLLFSSLAGQLADRYPKSLLIQKIKLTEVIIMIFGAIALLNHELILLFITLFLMGSQSAFFGPIKYSVLPEILQGKELIRANGLFSGSTFMAILLGTILGGVGVLMPNGTVWISGGVIGLALLGYVASLRLLPSQPQTPGLVVQWNLFKSSGSFIALCKAQKVSFFAVLAISWFWFLGAVMLSQIPTLVKYHLFASEGVVTAFLAVFSVGIALGSALIGRLLKPNFTLWAHGGLLFFISLLLGAMVWVIDHNAVLLALQGNEAELLSFHEFILIWPLNALLVVLLLIAILGGAYIVPLYTLLQTQTPAKVRARMIAVNNVLNALFMVLSAILVMVGFALSLSLLTILICLAVLNLGVAWWLQSRQSRLTIESVQ